MFNIPKIMQVSKSKGVPKNNVAQNRTRFTIWYLVVYFLTISHRKIDLHWYSCTPIYSRAIHEQVLQYTSKHAPVIFTVSFVGTVNATYTIEDARKEFLDPITSPLKQEDMSNIELLRLLLREDQLRMFASVLEKLFYVCQDMVYNKKA